MSKYDRIGTVAFIAIFALVLLFPFASNQRLPLRSEMVNSLHTTIQARQALEEGQFPLRIAPLEHFGWRYPRFQFYSSLPYLISGSLYKFVLPNQPYVAVKIVFFLALFSAGLFMTLTCLELKMGQAASLVAGLAYMSAPYLILNLLIRNHLTELLAQGLIPALLWTSLRLQAHMTPARLVAPSLALWAMLETHTVTFFYGTIFVVSFITLKTWIQPGSQISAKIRGLLIIFLAFAWGGALGAYTLVPIFNLKHGVDIGNFPNPVETNALTHLHSLLAFCPVEVPTIQRSPFVPHFTCAIGPLFVLAVILSLWKTLSKKSEKLDKATLIPALVLFGVFFLATWSPVNFWKFLPKPFWCVQFPYRFLTYTSLAGSFLLAAALNRKGIEDSVKIIWIAIIVVVVAAAPWITASPLQEPLILKDHLASPLVIGGWRDYLYHPDRLKSERLKIIPVGQISIPVEQTQPLTVLSGASLESTLSLPQTGWVQLPALYYPGGWRVLVNGRPSLYQSSIHSALYRGDHLEYALVTVLIPTGSNHVEALYIGNRLGNIISTSAWILTAIIPLCSFSFLVA